MTTLDLALASGGYLRAPSGRTRFIAALDGIAHSIDEAGLRVSWGIPPKNKPASAKWWKDEIVLAEWLIECEPATIRDCIIHEAGHCMVGPNDERVRRWQFLLYGDDPLMAGGGES